MPPLPFWNSCNRHVTDAHASQTENRVVHRVEHQPYLTFLAFGNDDFDQARWDARICERDRRGRRSRAVGQ